MTDLVFLIAEHDAALHLDAPRGACPACNEGFDLVEGQCVCGHHQVCHADADVEGCSACRSAGEVAAAYRHVYDQA